MAFNKLIIAVLFASAAVVLGSNHTSNDLIVGARVPNDYLLQRETIKKSSSIPFWIVTELKTFTGNNYGKISQVKLLDQNKKGNGATAAITNGGPGDSYVTVKFKSIRGHSIDFVVELYGR